MASRYLVRSAYQPRRCQECDGRHIFDFAAEFAAQSPGWRMAIRAPLSTRPVLARRVVPSSCAGLLRCSPDKAYGEHEATVQVHRCDMDAPTRHYTCSVNIKGRRPSNMLWVPPSSAGRDVQPRAHLQVRKATLCFPKLAVWDDCPDVALTLFQYLGRLCSTSL